MNMYTYIEKSQTLFDLKGVYVTFLTKQKCLIYKNLKKIRNLLKILGIIKIKL